VIGNTKWKVRNWCHLSAYLAFFYRSATSGLDAKCEMRVLNVKGPHGRQFSHVLKVSHLTLSLHLWIVIHPVRGIISLNSCYARQGNIGLLSEFIDVNH